MDDVLALKQLSAEDAEEAVIGGLFISGGEALAEITSPPLALQPEMLWSSQARDVFSTMQRLSRQGSPIDYVTLVGELGPGFSDYLLGLMAKSHYNAAWVSHYAPLVRQAWVNRAAANIAREVVQNAHEGAFVLTDTVARFKSLESRDRGREMTAADAIMAMNNQEYLGMSTGFPLLDFLTGGLIPTHFWVVDAFTSTGKTSFALTLTQQVIKELPVLYFSLEQSIEELMLRLIAMRSNLPARRIRRDSYGDELTAGERGQVNEAEDFFSRQPLILFDDLYSIEAIEARVMQYAQLYQRPFLVVLDYLQNLRWDDMFKVMSNAATSAQLLAKQAGCTVLALSQISNEEAQKSDSQYYAQKGSGAIRDAADKVLRLKRDRGESDMTIFVLKNRQGPAGKQMLAHFNLETGKIAQLAE